MDRRTALRVLSASGFVTLPGCAVDRDGDGGTDRDTDDSPAPVEFEPIDLGAVGPRDDPPEPRYRER